MIKKLLTWAVSLAALFVVAVLLLPKLQLLTMVNGAYIGVAFAVAYVYFPIVQASAKKPDLDRVDLLAIGIGLIWFSQVMQRSWWLYFHYMGSPQSLRDHYFTGIATFVGFIGGCLFVSAPARVSSMELKTRRFCKGNRWLLIVSAISGATIALAAFHYLKIY